MKYLVVFIGSGLGGCLRFGVNELMSYFPKSTFPIATFLSNVAACIVMGIVLGILQRCEGLDVKWKLFFAVGICGGFSTFSTFSNETLQFLLQKQYIWAIIYVLSSILACLLTLFIANSRFSE